MIRSVALGRPFAACLRRSAIAAGGAAASRAPNAFRRPPPCWTLAPLGSAMSAPECQLVLDGHTVSLVVLVTFVCLAPSAEREPRATRALLLYLARAIESVRARPGLALLTRRWMGHQRASRRSLRAYASC